MIDGQTAAQGRNTANQITSRQGFPLSALHRADETFSGKFQQHP
jgi:hypothetical protein